MNYRSDEGFASMEGLVICSVCHRSYWEAAYVIEAARRLQVSITCIGCDPRAEASAWYLLTEKGQAERC